MLPVTTAQRRRNVYDEYVALCVMSNKDREEFRATYKIKAKDKFSQDFFERHVLNVPSFLASEDESIEHTRRAFRMYDRMLYLQALRRRKAAEKE
jgi:hypothetical protein